jgi:hypothetical protein
MIINKCEALKNGAFSGKHFCLVVYIYDLKCVRCMAYYLLLELT